MGLDDALSAATSGLANVGLQFAVLSQNVTNASTPDYAAEVTTQTSLDAGGEGYGVQTGPATRTLNLALQAGAFEQDGIVAGLATQQTALKQVDAVQGTPGQGTDLSSLLGKLQDQFSTLGNDPSNSTQQSAVVSAAQSLTQQINALAGSYTNARQSAQDTVVADAATLNSSLATIGQLSTQITQLRAAGASTADLENQRDTAMNGLSQILDVKFLEKSNGDMLVMSASGLSLPTTGSPPPFAASSATLGASAYYPGGGVPEITLDGTDVTTQLTGGSLGAAINLRDTVLPTFQGQLDEFSETLATRFDTQGLRLLSDGSGNIPASVTPPTQSGYVGFSASIQVNPAVLATPSLVRDGTQSVAATPNGPSAFTPNPAGGPAGFTDLITRVLDYALGTQVSAGAAQPLPATTGLGPAGTLSSGYAATADLASQATALVSAQSGVVADTTAQLTTAQQTQSTLHTQLSAADGVNMDTEMSNMIQLQNSYGANARVISTLQAVWTQLLQMAA